MGQLILCMNEPAEVPYHMESASMNIYSLEEMSYYLIHNTDFIDADFMCWEFCDWIKEELKEEKISEELKKCIERGESFHVFVGLLLQAGGYASLEEIKDTQKLLLEYETKDELEQRKLRADRMLKRFRYTTALEEYRGILQNQKEDTSMELIGNVYHNMGTACVGMFLYEQAAKYFHKAYEKNNNPKSLKEEMLALGIFNKTVMRKRADEYEMGEAVLRAYEEELERIEEEAVNSKTALKIQKCCKEYKASSDEVDKQELLHIVQQWKQTYKAYGR